MKKDKITVEELKNILDMVQVAALENINKQYKEVSEKKSLNSLNPMAEFAFNMQNMMAMSEFKKELLKELGINE